MKKTKQIIAEDVLTIAKQIGFAPSDKQVEKILEMYDDAQADAPDDTWNFVVENLLYSIDAFRVNKTNKKVKKESYKCWVVIEKRTEYDDGDELYKDLKDLDMPCGEFSTLDEAISNANEIDKQYSGDFTK